MEIPEYVTVSSGKGWHLQTIAQPGVSPSCLCSWCSLFSWCLEHLPRTTCWRFGLHPWCCWEVVELIESGPSTGSEVTGDCALKVDHRTPVPSCFSVSLSHSLSLSLPLSLPLLQGTGSWTQDLRASQLLSRRSTTLAMPPALFVLVTFWIGSCVHAQASLDRDPLIYISHMAGIAGMCHWTQLLWIKMVVSGTFCPGLEQKSSQSLPPE
jgi:hypothetical protein